MLYLWIARHGLTQHNVDGIIQGHFDTDLNDEGRFQAELLSKWLERNCYFDLVLTSPLRRARDTALAIYKRQPRACQWRIDQGLIERDMGEWNNHKVVRSPRPKIREDRHPLANKDSPEEKADGSLGPVRIVEKPERQGRTQRREVPIERDEQVRENKVYTGEETRQMDIEKMMSRVELREQRETVKGPARIESVGDHQSTSTRQAKPNANGHGRIVPGVPREAQEEKDTVAQSSKKAARPPRPKVPGMESREAMEARCVKWAGQVITDGLERSRRTREDVHIMAVSHGAFISCLLDVLTWPRKKGGPFGFKFDGVQDRHCYNTSFSVVEIDDALKGKFLVNNHVPHLEPKATLMNPDDFAQ